MQMMGSMFPHCKFCMNEDLVIYLKYLLVQLVSVSKLIQRQLVSDWEGTCVLSTEMCILHKNP